MSLHIENILFNDLQIRDTNPHDSLNGQIRGFIPKTIIIINKLDQQVDFVCKGSRDEGFSEMVSIGSGFSVTKEANDYQTMEDYFPFFRMVATCSVAPTTGGLWVYLEMVA